MSNRGAFPPSLFSRRHRCLGATGDNGPWTTSCAGQRPKNNCHQWVRVNSAVQRRPSMVYLNIVLDLTTGAPHDCYEFMVVDPLRKVIHLKLATPVLHRNSATCSTRLARRQLGEWTGYTKSLMRRIGLENEIPDEAFTHGRTGALRGWYLPSFCTKEYEC